MTTRPNGRVFNRAHVDVGPTFGSGFYVHCSCFDCTQGRLAADWSGYVPSIPRPKEKVMKVDPYEQPNDLVYAEDVPLGAVYQLIGHGGEVLGTRTRVIGGGLEGAFLVDIGTHTTARDYRIVSAPEPEPVTFADLAEGDFFSNATDPDTLFVKRTTDGGSKYGLPYTAMWVYSPDGPEGAGRRCCIEDGREVILRDVSFKFD